jgi:hypothetical protein
MKESSESKKISRVGYVLLGADVAAEWRYGQVLICGLNAREELMPGYQPRNCLFL